LSFTGVAKPPLYGKINVYKVEAPLALMGLRFNNKLVMNDDKLQFIDFCAGIGAGRLGLQNLGLSCLAFSEIDTNSERTYREFFGEDEINHGDLTKINPSELPNFNMMIAGFPCQSFSVVGQRRGMSDHRGQLIYSLIKIMQGKNLPYFILENVKGLVNHDGGNSLRIILEELDNAGYQVDSRVLNSLHYGVPQMRERIYFVGIRKDLIKKGIPFNWPDPIVTPRIENFLIDEANLELNESDKFYGTFLRYLENKYNKGLFDVKKLLKEDYLVIDTRQSDARLYRGKVPTLRTGRHGILYVKNGKFRRLSGFESLLLQGFPKDFAIKVKEKIPDVYLLSQAGNAMTVNVIQAIGKKLLEHLTSKKYEQKAINTTGFANRKRRL
jgi:DNA (cytosine-5)-methyltransferase 1